jgi:DNA adenine methylase
MTATINLKPPIKYYGGKQNMLKHLLPLIPEHRIYDEPFLGGGALFWAKEPSKIEFINDISGEIVNFYNVIQNNFVEFKKKIDTTLHSEYQHQQAKEIYSSPIGHTEIDRAWAVFVLSHQSIYAVLGNTFSFSKERAKGNEIQNKKDLLTDIYAKRIEPTTILCRDALNVIKGTDSMDTFHYIDPPYFNSDMGHYKGYSIEDYNRLLDLLSTIKGKFLLSSYPSEVLTEYANKHQWNMTEINMLRCAGSTGSRKTEVLTANYKVEYEWQRA